jgi:Flp pilus assembly protein TadG
MRSIRAGANDERGAAAVEMAIVLPILVLLLFGITQFGLAFVRYQGVQSAAREGARIAALSQTTQSQIGDRVCAGFGGNVCASGALAGVPLAAPPAVAISPNVERPCNMRSGERVVVQVSATTLIEIPLWGSESVTLTGVGEFRCE